MTRLASLAALICLTLSLAVSGFALQVNPLDDNLVSVHLTSKGESRAEAEQQAMREAVKAAVGRVLLEDRLFKADDLLNKYLDLYAGNFVQGVEVVTDNFREGFVVLDSRVFVKYDDLIKDLEEKKFIYKAAYKPMFAVFMEERLEAERTEVEVARRLLENALQTQGMKAYTGVIAEPAVTEDVSSGSETMEAAIVAAERRNVEIIVTGQSNTFLREQKKLYYDNFFFYDCEMTIKAVRVDTNEVFFEGSARGAGSAKDQADAVRVSIERTCEQLALQVRDAYDEFWPGVVQAKRDYEILLTGSSEELTRITSEYLKRLGSDTIISTRKSFDRSAVLTIETEADRDAVIEAIRASAYPTLTIVREIGNRKFEVQVSG